MMNTKVIKPDNFLLSLVIFTATSNLIQEIKGELRILTIYIHYTRIILFANCTYEHKEQIFNTVLIMVY